MAAMAAIRKQAYELITLDKLKEHPLNPRKGKVEVIEESILVNGFYGAVVAERETGFVLAGNHRLMAARAAGMTQLPVIWLEGLSEQEAQRILVADNRTSDIGGYDNEQLAALLDGLSQGDGLDGTGYDTSDLEALMRDLTPAGAAFEDVEDEPTSDKAEELRAKWGVKLGQVWILGPHRLVCGDSTDAKIAALAIGGQSPALMVTDPPYGVEYDADWRNHAMRADGSTQKK